MGGHPTCTRNVSDTKTSQCSPDGWSAPRLSMALLHAKAGQYDVFKTKVEAKGATIKAIDENSLKDLLEHIQERLEKGLTEAWLSKEGYDYDSAAVFRDAAGKDQLRAMPYKPAAEASKAVEELIKKTWDVDKVWNDPEEQWARAIVEQFVFTSYAGPGVVYGSDDKSLYDKYPTTYPIAAACQHFSTFCIRSRGFTLDQVTKSGMLGCACSGGTTSLPCFNGQDTSPSLAKDPRWIAADAAYNADKATHDAAEAAAKKAKKEGATPAPVPPLKLHSAYGYPKQTAAPAFATTQALTSNPINLTPGSVVAFNPGGGASTYQDLGSTTHVASVLRVAGGRIQFMDTGVVTGNDAQSGGGEGGMADHSFRTGGLPAATSCVGWGRLAPAPNLAAAVGALAKSRPIGLVRLVVVDTQVQGQPRLCFVSKLLYMRYPLSRLIWSLHGLPVENLSVLWLVYAPQNAGKGGWADQLLADAAPSTAPSTLLVKDKGRLLHINVVRGDAGTVSVYRHKMAGNDNGWTKDLGGTLASPPPTPEMRLIVSATKGATQPTLEAWCENRENFDKRFFQATSGGPGGVDSGDVDVAFFRPA